MSLLLAWSDFRPSLSPFLSVYPSPSISLFPHPPPSQPPTPTLPPPLSHLSLTLSVFRFRSIDCQISGEFPSLTCLSFQGAKVRMSRGNNGHANRQTRPEGPFPLPPPPGKCGDKRRLDKRFSCQWQPLIGPQSHVTLVGG